MASNEKRIRYGAYIRSSSDRQDIVNSFARQFASAERYSKDQGGYLAKTWHDDARTGTNDRRSQFQAMIAENTSDDPPIDILLVSKYSRFARNVADSTKYKLRLLANGIRVISINEPVSDDPAGRLLEHILGALDQFYSENLSEDVKDGMTTIAKRGFFLGSTAPIGYKRVYVPDGAKSRPKLELDPPRDEIARLGFSKALNDATVLDIVREFYERGYRGTNGKPISRSRVHEMLRNRHYTGYTIWGVNRKDGKPPVISDQKAHYAIISVDNWKIVQEKLRQRAPNVVNPRTAASEHLFNGFGQCALCGAAIKIKSAKSGQYHYFICDTRDTLGPEACDLPPYPLALNDPILLNAILLDILSEKNLKHVIKVIQREARPAYERQVAQIANLDQALATLDRRENRILDAFEMDRIPKDKINSRLELIQDDMDELTAKRAEVVAQMGNDSAILGNPNTIIQYAQDIRTYLSPETVKSSRALIQTFVKTIWFGPKYADIEYHPPIPPDAPPANGTDDPEPHFGKKVLSSVPQGRPAITPRSLRIAGFPLRIAAPRRHLHRPVLQCPRHFPERLLIAGAGDVGLFHSSDFGRPGGGGNSVANLPGFFGHSLLPGRRVHTYPLRVARSILGFALVGQPLAHLPVPPDAGDQCGHQLAETALMGDSQQVAGVRIRRRRVPRCVKIGLSDAEPGAIGTVQVHLGVQDVIHRAGEPAHRRQVWCFGCRQCQASGKIHQVNVILGDEMPEPVHRQRPVPDTPNEWMVCHRLALGCRFPFYLLTK